MNIKLIVGGLGVAVAGTSAAALATQGFGLLKDTHWDPLSKDHDFSSKSASNGDYHNKFGSKYKYYLVGVVGKESGKEGNKEWWEESFKRLKKDNITTGKFKYVEGRTDNAVTKGYGTESTALNKVCEEAYKKSNSDFSDTEATKYKESEVWKYCSGLGEKT